jgi:tetratricopeptide (TPR) repeat protein
MRALPRLLLFLGLGYLAFVLFHEARLASKNPDIDPSKVVLLFAGVVLVGGCAAIIVVVMLMPRIGDAVGNFFFQPNQEIEKDPHSSAQAALARGDYATAVEEYRQILESEPADTLSYSEIAKISCEHLDDAAGAATLLEQALQSEWPPEDAAFLSTRLVDVYWKHQRDARSARALLLQIIETMPGTRHAANAEHRLQEIEQQIALEG